MTFSAMGVYGLTQVTGPYELTATASSCVIESDEVLYFLFKMGSTCVVLGRATAEQLGTGVAVERNLDDETNRFVNNSMASSSPDDTLPATVCTQVALASTQGPSTFSKGASTSTQGASAFTQGASNFTQGASASTQGASASTQGASTLTQVASASTHGASDASDSTQSSSDASASTHQDASIPSAATANIQVNLITFTF